MSRDPLDLKKKNKAKQKYIKSVGKHGNLNKIASGVLFLPLNYPIQNVTQRLKACWPQRLVRGGDRRWMKLSEPAAVALIQGKTTLKRFTGHSTVPGGWGYTLWRHCAIQQIKVSLAKQTKREERQKRGRE